MASIHQPGRRGVAALLCLYVSFINGLAMGNPPDVDTSGNKTASPKGIAYYASDPVYSGRVKTLSTMLCRAEDIWQDLAAISLIMCDCLCGRSDNNLRYELMEYFARIIYDHKVYPGIDGMFDEYRKISEESERKGVSPERLAELSNMMQNLEERFEGMEKILDAIDVNDVPELDEDKVQEATEFIAKYKLESTSNASGSAEPAAVVSGKPYAYGATIVKLIDRPFKALLESNPKFVASKGMIRMFLDDRSVLRRLDKLRKYTIVIYNILHKRSVKKAYMQAVTNIYNPITKDILSRSEEVYDTFCDYLILIRVAWERAEQYNKISDALRNIDVDSPEVASLIAVQEDIETKFEKYAFLIEDGAIDKLQEFYTVLLDSVRDFEMEINGRIPHIGTLVKSSPPL